MIVFAAIDLAGLAEHPHVVGILELDGEMVEDVAVLRAGADLPPAHRGHGPDRMRPQHPVHHVEVVDVLLDDSDRRRAR